MATEAEAQIIQGLACIKKALLSIDAHTRTLRDAETKKHETYDTMLSQENVIPANSSYTTSPVNNRGFMRCRIECNALFGTGNSAGIEIDVVYGNSPVVHLSDILCSNGSAMYKSEPIDVNHFSGFQFQLKNKDLGNSATIRNIKVILYNE
jgi:hypothetical protein